MTSPDLSWKNARLFRFVRHGFDPASGEAHLVYALDDGPELTETIRFPDAPWPQSPARQAAFAQALKLLHAIAGVSYYKTCVPSQMDTAGAPPDEAMAAFLERLYLEGLAEFAHANQLELEGRVRFRAKAPSVPPAPSLGLPGRALVAIGGGKDSLASLELLRSCGLEMQAVCVGSSSLIAETVSA
ncbi:MAG TPA: endonuclease domain-containing protein, partial [Xanthomonadales bacterium]|nr:endonuclease domain-containing protein [Xanthomonadales bacterium]